MKKIISFAALALLISLSASVFAQKKPIEIGKKEFLTKVANYETNPTTWQYLGDKPAIIDFYADWCKPCKLVEGPLKELAKEYEGKIYIYKVNVDKHKDLAKEIGISSIPTMNTTAERRSLPAIFTQALVIAFKMFSGIFCFFLSFLFLKWLRYTNYITLKSVFQELMRYN
jgi:thiol-disulfide isomerase/thioredoxin